MHIRTLNPQKSKKASQKLGVERKWVCVMQIVLMKLTPGGFLINFQLILINFQLILINLCYKKVGRMYYKFCFLTNEKG